MAGVVTIFALGDMIVYNRKKRASFFREQKELHTAALAEALEARKRGTADDDQLLLLNRERAAHEAEEARKNKKGVTAKVREMFFYGLSNEETVGRMDMTDKDTVEKREIVPGTGLEMTERESEPVRGVLESVVQSEQSANRQRRSGVECWTNWLSRPQRTRSRVSRAGRVG